MPAHRELRNAAILTVPARPNTDELPHVFMEERLEDVRRAANLVYPGRLAVVRIWHKSNLSPALDGWELVGSDLVTL